MQIILTALAVLLLACELRAAPKALIVADEIPANEHVTGKLIVLHHCIATGGVICPEHVAFRPAGANQEHVRPWFSLPKNSEVCTIQHPAFGRNLLSALVWKP